MSKIKNIVSILALAAIALPAYSANVLLGKTVTANGVYGVGGWGNPAGDPASITDGYIPAEQHQWDFDSLWWDANADVSNDIVIDLGGNFALSSLLIQADNNDAYHVQLKNGSTLVAFWDVPIDYSWGLVSHSVAFSPIVATQLILTANGGDGHYAISELQSDGVAVPEPGVLALMGLGLIAGALVRRRS